MTDSGTPSTLRRLTTSSVVYIVLSFVAAAIAISRNIAAQPLGEGSGTGRPVLQEFLIGNGTGMSPGLYWLALQAALTFLAQRRDRWGIVGVVGLGLVVLLAGIFATTEPTFRRVLSPGTFDPILAVVELAMVIVPLLTVIFAVLELLRRRRVAPQPAAPQASP